MTYTIPANYPIKFDSGALAFFGWITASGIDPAVIDPGHPITIRQDERAVWYIDGVTAFGVPRSWQTADFITAGALTWLQDNFPPAPPKDIALDELAEKIELLRKARKAAAEAKAEADEIRAEVMAAAVAAGAKVQTDDDGETVTTTITVNGEPVMVAKTYSKDQFRTAAFKAAYPELAAQYTGSRDETRLEFVK